MSSTSGSSRPLPRRPSADSVLSRRELEVLRLMAERRQYQGAGRAPHVSPATIRNHAQSIFTKLGVHSRLEAVAYATQNQLV